MDETPAHDDHQNPQDGRPTKAHQNKDSRRDRRRGPDRKRGHVTMRSGVAVAVAVSLGIIVIATAAVVLSGVNVSEETMRPAVASDGWSAVSMNCRPGSRVGNPRDRSIGPIAIGSGDEAARALEGCAHVSSGAGRPTRSGRPADEGTTWSGSLIEIGKDARHSYFVVRTGSDRSDVRLVEIEKNDTTILTVDHYYPGNRCGVTADWKGSLILVIRGPDGADDPQLRLRRVGQDC
ncbi:MAG: hypothetical protein V9F03_04640 [Microthrixaceae bacterium]